MLNDNERGDCMDRRAENARDARYTPLMCIALVAGIYAGARMAESYYRAVRRQRQADSEREQLKRWETEGGAIGGTVTTPPSA